MAAARAAMGRCAAALGRSVEAAALGVIEVAKSRMAEVVRLVTVQRGLDPREFALVTTGGAGPAMANLLVEELGLSCLVVPPSPGTASALGMLVSDVRHEFRTTRITRLTPAGLGDADAVFRRAAGPGGGGAGCGSGRRDGAALRALCRDALCRPELDHPGRLAGWRAGGVASDGLRALFDRGHERLYGYCVANEPVEIVNFGVLGIGTVPTPRLSAPGTGGPDAGHALKGTRPVVFGRDGAVACRVYDRAALLVGNIVTGPAIVEEVDFDDRHPARVRRRDRRLRRDDAGRKLPPERRRAPRRVQGQSRPSLE